ncbi:MAG: terminase family protein, partial [Clostridia bacterium]
MSNKNVIYKLLSLESELNLRNTFNKLKLYNTGEKIHKKQIEFHKCQKRNRWVFGGNRSGKTECGAVEALWLARGIHPYKINKKDVEGWIVSVSYEVQREVAQAKILNYLNPNWIVDIVMQEGKKASAKYGVIDCIVIKNVFGGLSKICFKSCDQGREKFQGASLDFVWFDEEPPFDIYEECAMRVLDKKGEIFGTMTPLKGLTWVYDTIFLNKKCNSEIWHIAMEWADNPYLDKEEINLLASSMSEESLQSRRFGNFTSSSCLVYGEFEQSKHVIDPFAVPNEWKDN